MGNKKISIMMATLGYVGSTKTLVNMLVIRNFYHTLGVNGGERSGFKL